MKHLLPIGLAVAFFPTDQLRAQDLIGAEEVIAQISGEKGHVTDPLGVLRVDLDEYRAALNSLTPEAAAKQWVDLVLRLTQIGTQRSWQPPVPGSPVTFQDLVIALPPTASWEHLEQILATRKTQTTSEELSLLSLRWFAHTLTGNEEAREKVYRLLSEKLALLSKTTPQSAEARTKLTEQMVAASDDSAYIFRHVEERFQAALTAADKDKSFFGRRQIAAAFSIPDLVAIIGEKDTQSFLQKALTSYPGEIFLEYKSDRMVNLARLIALDNIDKLAAAQWELTKSYSSQELYAALVKRFGPPKAAPGAENFEIARLILAGKVEDARKRLAALPENTSLPIDLLSHAQKEGKTDFLIQFFAESLREDPSRQYWRDFFRATLIGKKPEESISLMKETLARKDLSDKEAKALRHELMRSLLAAGQIEEGIATLRQFAKESLPYPSERPASLTMARIGLLMNRPEWEKEGSELAFVELEVLKKGGSDNSSSALALANALATTLLESGQAAKAEQVVTETLRWLYKTDPAKTLRSSEEVVTSLSTLVGIYADAGRSADVVTLLDRAPWWSATNLSQIRDLPVPRANFQEDYLADAAARALDAVGRKRAALRITEAQLAEKPGDDRAYEQLLRSTGAGALPILDRLAAQYRFEERPLIWKAQVLLAEGKLPEAEETIRDAIAIDPSDGEQGPGDRMRAYAVLADIRDARGDAKEAEFFRNVVKAIRLSEEADQLYKIGLISPAMAMYETSLTMFADAYCIQSRLALRMNEQGRWQEAEEHYRKAYELMPDSFGRVESHCFGCEGAFAGEKPQGVADKVFTRLAQEKPDSPRVQYLLGYLRESQGRPEEAMQAYQRAVSLDPDYLNAWKKMASLHSRVLLTTDERNAVALNLARLDPYSRSTSLSLNGVTDLGAVWTILSEADQNFTPTPKDLYPLKASTTTLESLSGTSSDRKPGPYTRTIYSGHILPTTEFAKAPFVTTTASLLQYGAALRNP